MSWNIDSSRKILPKLRNESKVFHVRLHYELKKSFYTVHEALNFPKIDKLDSASNFSELKWVIHNGLRGTTLIFQLINTKFPFHNTVGKEFNGVFA